MQVDYEHVAAVLPNYDVGGVLGRGCWGVVYAGRQRSLGRDVAIKELPAALASDPAVRARFVAEARRLASLDHPHVVPVYDFIESEGLCLLVMERLPGGTVAEACRQRAVTHERACALVLAAAAGLHHAHLRGVLHRDVKPENLMFSGAGTLKVTDFGIAKMLGGSATVATRTGEVLGSPAYMAPEQVRGIDLTPATDVYALAVTLYAVLSGTLPFSVDGDLGSVLQRRLHQEPRPLLDAAPSVPPRIAELTMQALAREPEARPPSCEAFGVAIAEACIATWGAGWLARTEVTVASAGPIVPAALGEHQYLGTIAPDARATAPPASGADVQPAELVSLSDLAGTPPPPPPAGARRRRVPAPVLWGLTVVAVGAGAYALGSGGGDDDSRQAGAPAAAGPGKAARAGSWQSLPAAPTARQQVGAAVVGGTIWIVGGLVGDDAAAVKATTRTEAFEPAIATWRRGPALPLAVHHAAAVSYGGELVVIGGFVAAGNLTARASDRVFALREGRWTELPRLRHARAAAAAVVVGDRIVVSGGQAGALVVVTEVFDGTRWRDVRPMPTPREHLAAASDGRFAYFVGGRGLSSDRNTDALERYDPRADRWATLTAKPTASGGLGAAVVGRRLIAVGGEDPASALSTVEAYDLDRQVWSTLPRLPAGRHGMGVVGLGRTLFAAGGATQASHAESSNVLEALTLRAG